MNFEGFFFCLIIEKILYLWDNVKKQIKRRTPLDFLNTITERPAVLIKCIVLILILAVPAVASTVRLIKRRAQIYAR